MSSKRDKDLDSADTARAVDGLANPAARLHLTGNVGKSAVEGLFPAVLAALRLKERLVIDVREIVSIDLDAVSALCGIHRHVVSRGGALQLEGANPEIIDKAIAGQRGFAPKAICSNPDKSSCLWA